MSKRKRSFRFGLLWLILFGVGLILYSRFWAQPSSPKTIPVLVTTRELLDAPGNYHHAYIMLADGVVSDPMFVLERSIFWVEDPAKKTPIMGLSARYRPGGATLRNAVFRFEIVYEYEGNCWLLLREIEYPVG